MLSTRFSLPFEGKWQTVWGGDTKELNQHHDDPLQKYAFDFVRLVEGKEYTGDGSRNEDYNAFGQLILAPADGTVVEVVDGVRDNRPRDTNLSVTAGNYILIKHQDNLFSSLAHFIQGSFKVKVGDPVKQGDTLGLCGNSGNSSQPHLHFHLQDSDRFYRFNSEYKTEPVASSVKCSFRAVLVEQEGIESTKVDYSPIKGDIISNP